MNKNYTQKHLDNKQKIEKKLLKKPIVHNLNNKNDETSKQKKK